MTDDLRFALEAALPDMTKEQASRARDLLTALTPSMKEPTWPGAPVIARCAGSDYPQLHVRRNNDPNPMWECKYSCASIEWDRLVNPRPLTPAEYKKYGIPMPAHTQGQTST